MIQNCGLNTDILTNSATMMGVCVTVIGLVKILAQNSRISSHVDQYLAVDMLLFTASAMFSYFSLRYEEKRRSPRYENLVDHIFMIGLTTLALCSFLVAFEFI